VNKFSSLEIDSPLQPSLMVRLPLEGFYTYLKHTQMAKDSIEIQTYRSERHLSRSRCSCWNITFHL